MTAHKRTLESLTKRIDTEAHAEQKILELREEAKKHKQWFEDHLASSAEVAKQAKQILKNKIVGMEDRHEREKQLWAEIKLQYEVRGHGTRQKSTHSSYPSMNCGLKWTWGLKESEPSCIRIEANSKHG